MLTKKDNVSLLLLIATLVLVNLFGKSIDATMWDKFTLFVNCVLAQGVFITLLNVFRPSRNRKPSVGLILLSLLTGLIAFVIIIASDTGLFNQILLIVLQAIITYAESLLLRREISGENGNNSKSVLKAVQKEKSRASPVGTGCPALCLWGELVGHRLPEYTGYRLPTSERYIRNRKYGAPISIIRSPEGISVGAMMVLPTVSAMTSSSPPSSPDKIMERLV